MGEQRLARTGFERFAADAEQRLRIALVATYGPVDGRSAAVDALSWAWEHWDRLQTMDNPVGYLYRVGQSAVRRNASRPLPSRLVEMVDQAFPEITPELLPALGRLSPQQRSVVVLIHAFGWTQRDVASMLGISPSTVREHLDRAVNRLREELEVRDAH